MVDKCNKCGERHPEKECPNRKSEDKRMKLTEKDKANIAAALAHSRKDKIEEILEAFGDNFSFFNGEIVGKEEHERFSLIFVRKIEVRHYTRNSPGFLHMEVSMDLTGEQIKKEIETRLFPDIIFYLKRDKLEEITGNEEKEELPEGESKMKYEFEERLKRIEERIGIEKDITNASKTFHFGSLIISNIERNFCRIYLGPSRSFMARMTKNDIKDLIKKLEELLKTMSSL